MESRTRSVEVKFPLIIIRSSRFVKPFERIGRLSGVKEVGWVSLAILPILAAFTIFLLSFSVIATISRPEVQEVQREAGAGAFLLIPGINPYIPILYGWIAIVIAIILHEGAHGVIASRLGFRVKSGGLLLLLGIPVGAFVELDDKELREKRTRDVNRVISAGPFANVAIAVISLIVLIALTSGLTTVGDVVVADVVKGSPAESVGLSKGDFILSIDGEPVSSVTEVGNIISSKRVGDTVELMIGRGERLSNLFTMNVTLGDLGDGKPRLGVLLQELNADTYLENYKSQSLSNPLIHFIIPDFSPRAAVVPPYADSIVWLYHHPTLGDAYSYVAKFLFWLWFVNVNVGLFNALPIFPLDGGQALRKVLSSTIGRRTGEGVVNLITTVVAVLLVGMIALLIAFPYLAR
ncbi:MAG: site-2 protease family protein [Aigarchaeota archaeon]|nr:site-2 protease family protein [Aigarchaeota archaeon]MDW8092908.1 site-2 protease family protein [Nitrososphaerota archaeon]